MTGGTNGTTTQTLESTPTTASTTGISAGTQTSVSELIGDVQVRRRPAGGFGVYKELIEDGDLVIVYATRSSISPLHVERGKAYHSRYGHYPHETMIGRPYGSQLKSKSRDGGFVYLLHPTPELWTLALSHRTQILYAHDMAFIMGKLNVRPGCRVIEAGTGSGSFTHTLARTIGNYGRLFSFEFHERRYESAREEFIDHSLCTVDEDGAYTDTSPVILTHRDVCKNGFSISDRAPLAVDAVFLDLPAPWDAIEHLTVHTSTTTRICCFSPCIEQVQKTVLSLKEHGWTGIDCFEVSMREWEARKGLQRNLGEAVDRLRQLKRKRADREASDLRAAGETDEKLMPVVMTPPPANKIPPRPEGGKVKEGLDGHEWLNIARPQSQVQSHTSFLLFATLLKRGIQLTSPADEERTAASNEDPTVGQDADSSRPTTGDSNTL
ncbi:tRNA (adenine-N(1)-)-methyltransferase catalytic subunit trm61 [Savitreella phatthalungensis]